MTPTTTDRTVSIAEWLYANPPPIRTTEMPAWQDAVRREFTAADIPTLLRLLFDEGEASYQAMGVCRALGLEVWAVGDDNTEWDIRYPDGATLRLRQPNLH